MPLDKDQMREYQRKRRAKGDSPLGTRADRAKNVTHSGSEGTDFGGEHYWGAVSQAPEGKRICTAFEFQGHMIGGCGKVVERLIHEPTLAQAIIDSPHYKSIQSKMPLTKTRG